MASYDRQFEIVTPSWEKLTRRSLDVADPRILNPVETAVVPIIDGELVQRDATDKFIRGANEDAPSYFVIDERGDYGVQGSRKLSVLYMGAFEADSIVFAPAGLALHTAVKLGTVNNAASGSVNRAGLVAHGGTGLVLGYVTRLPTINGGRLRFHKTLG
jgi:hypothetical protein